MRWPALLAATLALGGLAIAFDRWVAATVLPPVAADDFTLGEWQSDMDHAAFGEVLPLAGRRKALVLDEAEALLVHRSTSPRIRRVTS